MAQMIAPVAAGAGRSRIAVPAGGMHKSAFDDGMTYRDFYFRGGDPTGVVDSYSAVQSFLDGIPDGDDETHHSRAIFPYQSKYKMSHNASYDDRNHLTTEGQGDDVAYGLSGGALFVSSATVFTSVASGLFGVNDGATSRPSDLRFHGLNVQGGSTNYASTAAGSGGELQHGFFFYAVDGLWIANCQVLKNKGDGLYLGRSGGLSDKGCLNVKLTDFTVDKNGRMGVALISVDGLTVSYVQLSDIALSPIDYEPNSTANEGAWGTHAWDHIKFGDYNWDTSQGLDQPMIDINPGADTCVFAMDLSITNSTKYGHIKNPASGDDLTKVFRFAPGSDTVNRTGALTVTDNADTSGGETEPNSLYGIMDIGNFTNGPIDIDRNVGFMASGVNWIKDRGGNAAYTPGPNNT